MLLTATLVLAAAMPQARPLPPDRPLPRGQQIETKDGDTVVIHDYTMLSMPGGSLGISTDGAFVQLFSGSPASQNRYFADQRAIVLNYRGGNRDNAMPGGSRQPFDEIEPRAVANATRNAATPGRTSSVSAFDGPGGAPLRSSVTMSVPSSTPQQQPVRVGSGIITPVKTTDVKPVMPPAAAQAGIRGTVILEVTIGADGAVTDAKVLRSVPLLDQAALDAVRQWRYAPTIVNGTAVPVILTVPVAFP